MTVIYPEGTSVQGNTKVKVVLSVADPEAPSLATEVNAASSLDISCFLRDWNPEMTSNSGTAPSRLCTTTQLPLEGNTQFSPIEIRYLYDPQGDDADNDNKARELLVRGTEFYAVVRKGLDARDTAFAADQYIETWKFRCGRQNRVRSGDDEFSEYEISQMLYPILEPAYGQVAA